MGRMNYTEHSISEVGYKFFDILFLKVFFAHFFPKSALVLVHLILARLVLVLLILILASLVLVLLVLILIHLVRHFILIAEIIYL